MGLIKTINAREQLPLPNKSLQATLENVAVFRADSLRFPRGEARALLMGRA